MTGRCIKPVGLALLFGIAAAQGAAVLESDEARLSYALGMNFWHQLRDQSIEVDPQFYIQGFRDALSGRGTLLNKEEADAALNALSRRQIARQAEKAVKNKRQSEAFLSGNKAMEGVVTLESGLQYRIVTTGDGDKPSIDDMVVVHYRGRLIDGTEFDSSHQRGQPATIAVKRVIQGWTEALQLMPVGSKWQLFIPPELAYGKRGAGRHIGPSATLVFEVELIAIKDTAVGAAKDLARDDDAVATSNLKDIQVVFKQDRRLTQGLYMGERWVSPSTYSSLRQQGQEYTLEARAYGIDSKGRRMPISPEWIPADADMVVVSPTQGDAVKITVKRGGESRLNMAVNGFSKELLVKAISDGRTVQVKISQ